MRAVLLRRLARIVHRNERGPRGSSEPFSIVRPYEERPKANLLSATSMRLQFREYRATDREPCIAVFRTNVPRFFRDHELSDYLEFIDSSGSTYFVVVSGGCVVGCGGYGVRRENHAADLCWGMVDAGRHRSRIGSFLLIGRLHRIIAETDATSVRLATSQLTEGFFLRFGFTTESTTPSGIADGLDDVQMHMELAEDVRDSIERQWREIGG